MTSNPNDVLTILSTQQQHQLAIARRRQPRWITWLFVIGLGVSIVGLALSIAAVRAGEPATRALVACAVATVFFGWAVTLWLIAPLRIRPRIVPYFTRELGPVGGDTMAAFVRGRGLYREIVALERLAATLGVTPLSAFGFAYDYYEQEVRWHAAADGLRTVMALRRGLEGPRPAAPDVAADLETLARVLTVAADRDVAFSLVLRLHAKDSLQAVCTREVRQGSFW
jgi:hypothetical protein